MYLPHLTPAALMQVLQPVFELREDFAFCQSFAALQLDPEDPVPRSRLFRTIAAEVQKTFAPFHLLLSQIESDILHSGSRVTLLQMIVRIDHYVTFFHLLADLICDLRSGADPIAVLRSNLAQKQTDALWNRFLVDAFEACLVAAFTQHLDADLLLNIQDPMFAPLYRLAVEEQETERLLASLRLSTLR